MQTTDTIESARSDYEHSGRTRLDWVMYVARVEHIRANPPTTLQREIAARKASVAARTYRLALARHADDAILCHLRHEAIDNARTARTLAHQH